MLPQPQWPSDLKASGRITGRDGAYTLELTIDRARQRAVRSLSSPNCLALSETGAWLIAVSIDPAAATAAQGGGLSSPVAEPDGSANGQDTGSGGTTVTGPQLEAVTEAEAVDASVPPAHDAPAKAASAGREPIRRDAAKRSEGSPLWWRGGVFGGVWSAGLPGVQASLGARAGLGVAHAYIELRGAHMFTRQRRGPFGALELDSQQLGFAACGQWGERLRGGPCLTVSGLRTRAHLRGSSSEDVVFWANAGAAANLAWIAYGPLELHVEAGLSLPISGRPRFQARGLEELERASFLAGHGELSVCVRLE